MQNAAISRCCFVTFGKQRQRNEHRIITHAYTTIVLVAVAEQPNQHETNENLEEQKDS